MGGQWRCFLQHLWQLLLTSLEYYREIWDNKTLSFSTVQLIRNMVNIYINEYIVRICYMELPVLQTSSCLLGPLLSPHTVPVFLLLVVTIRGENPSAVIQYLLRLRTPFPHWLEHSDHKLHRPHCWWWNCCGFLTTHGFSPQTRSRTEHGGGPTSLSNCIHFLRRIIIVNMQTRLPWSNVTCLLSSFVSDMNTWDIASYTD